ncbi:MAG: FeoC-like transcriptional regulator [Chloroflexota bacterium]|nr:FeoC-like transcriptional regulator [Chloroflexota bacterium]
MTMLNRLLELLRAGGTHRVADLARELETTPALVEAMLEDLTRMGYLKHVGGECGTGCAGCSLAGLCAAGESGQVWTLTEKG